MMARGLRERASRSGPFSFLFPSSLFFFVAEGDERDAAAAAPSCDTPPFPPFSPKCAGRWPIRLESTRWIFFPFFFPPTLLSLPLLLSPSPLDGFFFSFFLPLLGFRFFFGRAKGGGGRRGEKTGRGDRNTGGHLVFFFFFSFSSFFGGERREREKEGGKRARQEGEGLIFFSFSFFVVAGARGGGGERGGQGEGRAQRGVFFFFFFLSSLLLLRCSSRVNKTGTVPGAAVALPFPSFLPFSCGPPSRPRCEVER